MSDNNPLSVIEPGSAVGRYAPSASADAESARAIAEIQGAMIVARRFPRDQVRARDAILAACTRTGLAEVATFSYSRGNQTVTGATIRIAEMIAQAWGNIDFGIKELTQANGESEVEAFAFDLETLARRRIVFKVPHLRVTKTGVQRLTDPRDVYELIANQGARRLRACILSVVPGDLVESALAACEETLLNSGGAPADQMKKVVAGFAEYGVTPEQLAAKLGHRLEATNNAEVLRLKKIYRAIKDGFTSPGAEFVSQDNGQPAEPPKTAREAAKRAANKTAAPAAATTDKPKRRTYAEIEESLRRAAQDEPEESRSAALALFLNEADESLPDHQCDELRRMVGVMLGDKGPE